MAKSPSGQPQESLNTVIKAVNKIKVHVFKSVFLWHMLNNCQCKTVRDISNHFLKQLLNSSETNSVICLLIRYKSSTKLLRNCIEMRLSLK